MSFISMHQGDDRVLTITASEDLTGAGVRFTARRQKDSEEALLDKSSPGAITVTGNQAAVAIDEVDTAYSEPGSYYWDVRVVDDDLKGRIVAWGRLELAEAITSPTEGS